MASADKTIKVDLSLKEMATTIACSIYQSSGVMEDIKEVMDASGSKMTVMEYVAIMAVETAHQINKYSTKWES